MSFFGGAVHILKRCPTLLHRLFQSVERLTLWLVEYSLNVGSYLTCLAKLEVNLVDGILQFCETGCSTTCSLLRIYKRFLRLL